MLGALRDQAHERFQVRNHKLLTLNSRAAKTAMMANAPVQIRGPWERAPDLRRLGRRQQVDAAFDLEVKPEVHDDGSISMTVQILLQPGLEGAPAANDNLVFASALLQQGETLLISGLLTGTEPAASVSGAPEQTELLILLTPRQMPALWTPPA